MAEQELQARIQEWDQASWCLAAVAVALRPGADQSVAAAAHAVLPAHGLRRQTGGTLEMPAGATAEQLAAQASAPLLRIAGLLSGEAQGWSAQTDETRVAQGRASSQMAKPFEQYILPALDGLARRLASPGAAMLDVGTGVGGIAVAFAETFPALHVVGIDVMPRVLALGAQTVAASSAADRVELRLQDVAELTEREAYDLAWLPAPFLPRHALVAGTARVADALRPGGWLLLGHGKFAEDELENALNAFKTTAYGGTALDDREAATLLSDAGMTTIARLPTPEGAPALTVGRAPAGDPIGTPPSSPAGLRPA